MDAHEFLDLATSLATEDSEAAWRTAVSRAYYAAFHLAGQLLTDCGFKVPDADYAHSYLWLRLCNAGILILPGLDSDSRIYEQPEIKRTTICQKHWNSQ